MAHFAKLEDNIVTQVIVVGDEYETTYAQWRLEFGEVYVQTSYNGRIRKNYAGKGYTYDVVRDAFIAPKCHDVAILDEATCRWTCEDSSHEATTV
tara:strand:+ start:976 stop:1260 length:285 start_codon:yes stop_codon:yes gene_type:complete